jgi:hypothetical protein
MTRPSTIGFALCACFAYGCGSGGGLMHPAHTLPEGHVTMGAGVSSQFVLGEGDDKIQAARAVSATGSVPAETPEEQTYIEGAMAETLGGPGLAPWVGARVGVGYTSDAGLTYTGRRARLDGRHAFEDKSTAVSLGLGASAILAHPSQSEGDAPQRNQTVPGFDSGPTRGWGFDIPVIVGWRSSPSLVQVWGGARGGYDRMIGDVIVQIDPDPGAPVEEDEFEASRWFAVLVAGIGVGIDPVMVAVEVDAGYLGGKGSVIRLPRDTNGPGIPPDPVSRRLNGKVETFIVTPTAAAIVSF